MFCFIKEHECTAHIVFFLFPFPPALLCLCQTFLSFSSADQELKRVILLLFVSLLDEFCVCMLGAGACLKFKEVMGTKEIDEGEGMSVGV